MKIRLLLTCVVVQVLISSCTTVHNLHSNVIFSPEAGKYESPDGRLNIILNETISGDYEVSVKKIGQSSTSNLKGHIIPKESIMCWNSSSTLWYYPQNHPKNSWIMYFSADKPPFAFHGGVAYNKGDIEGMLEKNKIYADRFPTKLKKEITKKENLNNL